MGTKRKFWYRHPASHQSDWMFKYPRQNTGEHWAEKIVAEVASALKIPHARVELAETNEDSSSVALERGSTTKSFSQVGIGLIHGNQIMTLVMPSYEQGLDFHQSYHTLDNIFEGLGKVFGPHYTTTPGTAGPLSISSPRCVSGKYGPPPRELGCVV